MKEIISAIEKATVNFSGTMLTKNKITGINTNNEDMERDCN